MDKDKLVGRIEAATEPNFALFADAFEAIHGGRSSLGLRWSEFCSFVEAEAWLDAAMTLVPEGPDLHIEVKKSGIWAFVGQPVRAAKAATPALALCAAALRSHAPK